MQKLLPLVNGLFFFGCCYFNNGHGDRRHELDFVGMYYLTNYPNCDSCKVNLVDNNSYVVLKNGKVTEKGDWHFESGCDYLIVYMNNKKDQLGSGRFEYSFFINKEGKRIE